MIGLKKIWAFRKGKWALGIISFFLVIALFADFIANEKPIYCKYNGEIYFPVLHEYGEGLGLLGNYEFLNNKSWQELQLEEAIFPIIKFSSGNIDQNSSAYSRPSSSFENGFQTKKHWLGSDSIGRDVAAGIVQGTRKTLSIAFFAMLISCLIGFVFGILSGFFGDRSVRMNLWAFIGLMFFIILIWFQWSYNHWSFGLALIATFVLISAVFFLSPRLGGRQFYLPLDLIIMRMIEVFKSVPALFILLALLAIISKPNIFTLIIIIGILRWSTIARVLRAELLRLKENKFITSAKAIGSTDKQIIVNHLLPNALPSLLTVIAFGFAGTILLEASISFLGIGLSAEEVTWGSILSEARNNFSAWWLAVFPGAAIFLMVVACNYLGDTLNEINLRSN